MSYVSVSKLFTSSTTNTLTLFKKLKTPKPKLKKKSKHGFN